jgi:hypothetical protein
MFSLAIVFFGTVFLADQVVIPFVPPTVENNTSNWLASCSVQQFDFECRQIRKIAAARVDRVDLPTANMQVDLDTLDGAVIQPHNVNSYIAVEVSAFFLKLTN